MGSCDCCYAAVFLVFLSELIPCARLALLLAVECHGKYPTSTHGQRYTLIRLSDNLRHTFVAGSSI